MEMLNEKIVEIRIVIWSVVYSQFIDIRYLLTLKAVAVVKSRNELISF